MSSDYYRFLLESTGSQQMAVISMDALTALRAEKERYRIALQSIVHLAVPRLDTIMTIANGALEAKCSP